MIIMSMTQRSLFSIPTEVVKFNLIKHFKLETQERAFLLRYRVPC